jgi:hypothetical protein
MKTPLKRKLEQAIKAYLLSSIEADTPLFGLPIYDGRGDLTDRVIPSVTVFIGQLQANDTLPVNCGEYVATLLIQNVSQADDQEGKSVSIHDDKQQQLETLIADVASLKAFINKPSVGTDSRDVQDVYIYDSKQDEEQQDFKLSGDRTLDDVLTFRIPCRNDNGDGT